MSLRPDVSPTPRLFMGKEDSFLFGLGSSPSPISSMSRMVDSPIKLSPPFNPDASLSSTRVVIIDRKYSNSGLSVQMRPDSTELPSAVMFSVSPVILDSDLCIICNGTVWFRLNLKKSATGPVHVDPPDALE
ncbi:unnamed protein product [Pseudo-nitzschia multistriata]|uniref:Uncharacterized protein n=1 Tax=Pseudo-nitzschia multistriata TaxID=183589 RepID=A0A448ZBK2_9STRA|nr:unnamed protein product [Pseudo-nitzschia multistriata]